MITHLAERYTLGIEERRVTEEDVIFKLPAPLILSLFRLRERAASPSV